MFVILYFGQFEAILDMKDFIDREAISYRLKQLLDESGMSSKEFAIVMKIAQPTLSQIMTGKAFINLETINKIVRYGPEHLSGFNVSWFVFGEGRPCSDNSVNNNEPVSEVVTAGILVKQAEEIGQLRGLLEQCKPKEIERIVVFYTDNSIATYKLSE